MNAYDVWKRMPNRLRGIITNYGEFVLSFLFFKGRKLKYHSTTFRVNIDSFGAFRRSSEFLYKEGAFTESIYHAAKKHQTIYDIGAHVGYYVTLMAKANLNANVIAFEPEEKNYDALNKNVQLNKLHNVKTINVAVGKDNTDLFLESSSTTSRAGTGTHRFINHGHGNSVKSVKLDDWLKSAKAPSPSMILIDIEGSELEALKGMERILENYSPELYVEVHPKLLKEKGESEEALDKYLYQLGFTKEILRSPSRKRHEHQQKHVRYFRPTYPK